MELQFFCAVFNFGQVLNDVCFENSFVGRCNSMSCNKCCKTKPSNITEDTSSLSCFGFFPSNFFLFFW